MKKILLCLLLACSFMAKAQVYNNEWINFSNTYYKFKVGKTGLYRISQTALVAAGLGGGGAEQFQLWRNGVEIPIYTSIPTGTLSATDYIEFWGEMNDGKPDKDLYRDPDYQLNDKWSLETDSATYFLTIATSPVKRLMPTTNNVAANTLAPEPYFMHTVGEYFRDKIKGGYAVYVDNQYLYSSSYDKGEGWASTEIGSNGTNSLTFSNLQVYAAGPASKFWIGLAGDAIAQRNYIVRINNDSIVGGPLDYYDYAKASASFPTSLIATNSASVQVKNVCTMSPCPTSDRMSVYKYEITYPRLFDFGAATNFEFNLPASSVGNYLEIKNFAYGTAAPVLYDLTNGKRYVADISAAPFVRIALEPSAIERRLVLVSQESTNINSVSNFQQRVFRNYRTTDNQGDYLIISNSVLFSGPNASNPVEDYRAYRASSAGGAYNAKIYLVDEIIDQFGFGIKKNPLAIRNFARFARAFFSTTPKHVFIIGRGVEYTTQRDKENDPIIEKLNLVPAFGVPASDLLYTADPGSSLPKLSIGRLSVVNGQEISDYLVKVKQAEQAQATLSPLVKDRAWQKNILHLAGGGGEQTLAALLGGHLRDFKKIIEDTLFGGNVYSLTKETSGTVEQIDNALLAKLYSDGLGMITYFGHSGASSLEFNVEDPSQYNNTGKYPLFVALGCNAGNIFGFNGNRLFLKNTTSENYVLIPSKGSIGFIASTHFGIVHYLGIWGNTFYSSLSNTEYGKTIGEIMNATAKKVFNLTSEGDFYSRANVEELNLMGDPAIRIYPHAKPDYVIEEPMVKISPFVSSTDGVLKLNLKLMNIGQSVNKDIVLEIKHLSPSQDTIVAYRDTIKGGIDYSDSLVINIPIDANRDKGENKLIVTIDSDNDVEELYETNNSITKDFVIYENEARPVYPYNFAIINKQNIKFYGSTANPLMQPTNYRLEIDTTEAFNSSSKISSTISSSGGLLEFLPTITFVDSTVYYWRVGPETDPENETWSGASFIYLSQEQGGFNQSHFYQQLKSDTANIRLDSSTRRWIFRDKPTNLFIRNAVWGSATGQEADLTVSVNGSAYIRSACALGTLVFNIFSPITALPDKNLTGKYGSAGVCIASRQWNFEYSMLYPSTRKLIMNFMDSIPEGYFVIVRSIVGSGQNSGFINDWKSDTSLYGSNNSLYHKLKAQGFDKLDLFTSPKAFTFVYRKGAHGFEPVSIISNGLYDKITLSVNIYTPNPAGTITSPILGPATKWKKFQWDGQGLDASFTDKPNVDIVGIDESGITTTLVSNIDVTKPEVDVSSIDAKVYPYLQLKMHNADSINFTPYQLKYWRLIYDAVPEGAVAPNIVLSMKDTLDVNEPLKFKVAFKNISESAFDSLRVRLLVTDKNNVNHLLSFDKHKPLSSLDTLNFEYKIDTKSLVGLNTLFVEMNPDNEQPEQFSFNNFLYKSFYVRGDTVNPFMDVTFDNRHILNNDIVSPKPEILIKIKDDAKWMLLDDTALVNIKVRYPDGTIHSFSNFNNDTLSFNKNSQPTQQDNTATITFTPNFAADGIYELIVTAKDKSGNKAGSLEYRISFQVINKPMISNLLNYPNPFTTSTAFVFTLTGSEVPQNLKIQILTITGKVVREITKQELGLLQIGRNITEFKWDGTDQYGQKLANGIYLYRVITNLNGKSLDKYRSENDDTDKYFNKGYGKMYLMR